MIRIVGDCLKKPKFFEVHIYSLKVSLRNVKAGGRWDYRRLGQMAKNDIDPLDYRYYQLTTFFNRYLFFGHDLKVQDTAGLERTIQSIAVQIFVNWFRLFWQNLYEKTNWKQDLQFCQLFISHHIHRILWIGLSFLWINLGFTTNKYILTFF